MTTSIGNFEIIEQIASGGMGVIYKARQTSLDRIVVIKELKSSFKEDSEVVARFEQEAKAVARLQHENIINVIEFWHKKGSYYIAMEYLDGADLAGIIGKTGPLPLNIGLIIASQIARALGYAHERGIVHRDLKPSNIFASWDGKVKLVDFGIAHIEEELGGKDLTRAGASMGTPAYMSPEQTDGKPAEPSSDIWSFGCVLYEIFSGSKAFTAIGKSTLLENIRKGKRAPQSDQFNTMVPWGLRRMINRCLKIKPEKRPSAQKLMTYLVHLAQKKNRGKDYSMVLRAFFEDKNRFQQAGVKTVVKRPQQPDKPMKSAARFAAAALLILLIGGAGYVLWGGILRTARVGAGTGKSGSEKHAFTKTAVEPVRESETALPVRTALPQSGTSLPVSSAAVSLSPSVVLLPHAAEPLSRSIVPVPGAAVSGARTGEPLSHAAVPLSHTVAVVPVPQETGYIRVVALPWAEIYIDGKKAGLTPTDRRFQVTVGRHKVLLKNPYYVSVVREVEVSNNRIVFVKAYLNKQRRKK
jgi:serine/threonine protein kinase